jgi:hypothetical protein
MDSFSRFIISEGVNITASPELADQIPQAKKALMLYLQRYGDKQELKASMARFKYTLTKVRQDDWNNEVTYHFTNDTIDKGKGRDEIISDKSDDRYEYYPNWDGRTGKRVYKSPKDAIDSIPNDENLAYRGMSWEEWRSIQKTGIIQSKGQHNFSNQGSLTFFGPKSSTGESYAGGFAPNAYSPTPVRPGVVIAVPKNLLKTPKDNPNIPQGELAFEGTMDAKNIVNAWMLVATKTKPGKFDVVFNLKTNQVREGSRMSISVSYSIRQIK